MNSNQVVSLLRLHDAFRGLAVDEVNTIVARGEIVHAEIGDKIHRSGQKVDAMYLVALGRLKMSLNSAGGEQRTIHYIAAGDQFGALCLVADDDIAVDVDVDETAILLRLDRETAFEVVQEFPVLRRNLLRRLGISFQDTLSKHRKRTNSKLVTFIHADDQTRTLVAEIATRLASYGEKIGILCDSKVPPYDSSIPYHSICDLDGNYKDSNEVRNFINQWVDLERILVVVDRVHPAENLANLVALADMVFCMSTTSNRESTINELKGLVARAPVLKKKMYFVWALEADEQVAPFEPNLPNLLQRDFKVQLADSLNATRLFSQGIDRIVHYLRGVSIGLALSGGAAHGMAHLGVLKAFEEAGITIDKMAGTSAGVLTGVIYCAGFSPDWGINHFAKDLEPGSIYKKLPKGDGFYMLHQYRSQKWDHMLRIYLNEWRLEQLPVPVSTVTTDLISARSVTITTGDSVQSILESINLPVISKPICRDGMLLVDGGILNNLPADVLVKQDCNFIIGVDVAANIEHRVGKNSSTTPTKKMKAPGAVATLTRCLNIQAHNMSNVGAQPADVIIAPDVSKFSATAFNKAPEMAEVGYQATLESMPRIRNLLKRLDDRLFGS